ncbi:MAG TPA: hypothetical protein VH331_01605 [Allosphingosinicella sp.]|jgi:hypothetical protein|nr:hypothetical protein [Allosphingosinicella sp.]
MHVHLPKPLHGWRAFFGEVAIIVLGVLIALGAEQLVEWHRWNREVHETRLAADAELAHDLGVFRHRLGQQACVESRLKDLERWLQGWRDGKPVALKGPIASPPAFGLHFNVWDATAGEARAHMDLETKLAYAGLYDVLKSFDTQRLREREAWGGLSEYDGATSLDHQDMLRVRGLISRIRSFNGALPGFSPYLDKPAATLGIKPDLGPLPAWSVAAAATFCRPLI